MSYIQLTLLTCWIASTATNFNIDKLFCIGTWPLFALSLPKEPVATKSNEMQSMEGIDRSKQAL